ncbi:hypothetical protein GLAREA_02120 [Glarea lozoyensis ATCC 20868]|uniref:Uncharacterized protein n=1 Tax=Glarea lozoyensis (strain ATCC 20868 / MF5171) TaxID=1116229 RepID=S3DI08_GLAL2|nr:uncharacterized protein GLAREA_02120 [Glarea lozoyensis ATCC 20868]EPE26208.1 hypothetical protein GLAREA_02120 [Glarea lozoyensis ATCC 20868]
MSDDYVSHPEKVLHMGGSYGAIRNNSTSQLDLLKHLKDSVSEISKVIKLDYLTVAQQSNQIMKNVTEQLQRQGLWGVPPGVEIQASAVNTAYAMDLLMRDLDMLNLRTRIKCMAFYCQNLQGED